MDVSLSLNNSNYKPYCKPDNETLYTHKDSNRPPSIFKQIRTSIERRISALSSNESILNESKEMSQKALEKSGYRQILKCQQNVRKQQTKMSATTNEIENEMLFGLTLHLVLRSKQKSENIF